MAAIDQLLHDITTLSKQRDTAAAAATVQAAGGTKSLLMALPIGTRVIDLITGHEGVIVDGHRENVVVPLAVQPGS